MSTLTPTPPITHKIEQIVRAWGKSAEQVIEDAINEHLNKLNSNKLDAETAAFEQKHPWLKKHYLNEFIAMHHGQVIDSDPNFEPLYLRVQEQFGDVVVLIQRVCETPIEEFFFRSRRLEVIE